MDGYKVLITGADSAYMERVKPSIPLENLTKEEAEQWARAYQVTWVGLGYRRTAAGIYVRGSEWRSALVIAPERSGGYHV